MSEARDAILGRIRRALKRSGPLTSEQAASLRARDQQHAAHVLPALPHDQIARFTEKLQAVSSEVSRVNTMADVPGAVLGYIERHGLEPTVVLSNDDVVSGIVWPNEFKTEIRAANGDDGISVTGAFAGVAETGTVALLSGPESPTTLNFLPEDHIVVLPVSRMVPHLEDIWRKVRERGGGIPRTMNLITGPSKTADVEQTIQMGAHGPRRFMVVLVGESGAAAESVSA